MQTQSTGSRESRQEAAMSSTRKLYCCRFCQAAVSVQTCAAVGGVASTSRSRNAAAAAMMRRFVKTILPAE
eukprot:4022205-Pleurochrysis_carterae.AAC.1